MFFPSWCKNPLLPVRAINVLLFKVVGIRLRTETCANCCRPIAMVPRLHQGNIYIKKKDKGMERPEMHSPNRCKNPSYL